MGLDPDTCYRALCAHDARFDGVFFVGVTTTGIYCRPVCRARVPGRDRCVFYARAAEAERDGFRACLRCRPELAPGGAPVDAVPRLVRAANARVEAGYLNEASVDDLARELGVTARHLRRSVASELGVSLVALAQSRRLALAKQLLHDTALPLTEVAFASGFASVRRFNALFRERFGRAPSTLRRERRTPAARDAVALRLDYRPPLDWETLLAFLAGRAIPGVESVRDGAYVRTVRLGGKTGWVSVRPDERRDALRAEVSLSLVPVFAPLVARLRAVFDLDAQPRTIAEHLGRDALLAAPVASRPGMRVPGAFDGFETAVRAILGQQVTVRGATTVSGRLAQRFGTPVATDAPGLDRLFPDAATLARATEDDVAALGMPGARARAVIALARAVADRAVCLERGGDPAVISAQLKALPGVGEWTAQYVTMRVLGWPDAFPASDLALRNALGGGAPRAIEQRADAWRPWRSYAALHLWTSLAQGAGG